MDIKVSVVIPTYNREKLLPRAIKSVLRQTYQNWELLVIDDGSTDSTRDVVQTYCNQDSRVRYFYKENGGIGTARNFGVKKASADFLIFLDSDDIFLPNILEEEIKYTEEYKIIAGGAWVVKLENKKIINYVLGHTDCCLFKKELFEKYGYYDEERNFSEDFGLGMKWTLAEFLNNNFIPRVMVNEPLCLILKHGEHHLTDNLEWLIISTKSMADKYSDVVNILPNVFSDVFLRLGHYENLSGNMDEGRKYLIKSLSLEKFKLSAFVLYLSTFTGIKIYSSIFNLMNWVRQNIFWEIKIIKKKEEYPNLYNEAIKIIEKF